MKRLTLSAAMWVDCTSAIRECYTRKALQVASRCLELENSHVRRRMGDFSWRLARVHCGWTADTTHIGER